MIQNPILKGFNPDPCICRKGEDYYIAVSSFEWFPGIPVYHSKDLKNWELLTHVLTSEKVLDVKRLTTGQGIWAPNLTYCEEEDLFYVVYGSMIPSGVNIDNYLITAKDIKGPWSEPVYLHSAGFDASVFHDPAGKKYILSLESETRTDYKKPGEICMAEYDPVKKSVIGYPKRIWNGSSGRGWIEGPQLYKKNDMYYILCAEGGTGYHHCAAVGRSKNVWGPYEKDPKKTVITSYESDGSEGQARKEDNYRFYNENVVIQKSGHASLVETQTGELFAVHLCGRPTMPEMCCTLGRESAVQKMAWSADGWIRMADGSSLAKDVCEESGLKEYPMKKIPEKDDFDDSVLGIQYYSPRYPAEGFIDLTARPGYLRIRGQQNLDSLDRVSLVGRKLTSMHAVAETRLEFYPEVYQHSAGLLLYYDNYNYIYLRKYYSETLRGSALSITQAELGKVVQKTETRVPVEDRPVTLRLTIEGKEAYFEWAYDSEFRRIGGSFDTTRLSDEYCGLFTGTFTGIACTDGMFRRKYADFDYFLYEDKEG